MKQNFSPSWRKCNRPKWEYGGIAATYLSLPQILFSLFNSPLWPLQLLELLALRSAAVLPNINLSCERRFGRCACISREVTHTFETVGRQRVTLSQIVVATGTAHYLEAHVMVKVRFESWVRLRLDRVNYWMKWENNALPERIELNHSNVGPFVWSRWSRFRVLLEAIALWLNSTIKPLVALYRWDYRCWMHSGVYVAQLSGLSKCSNSHLCSLSRYLCSMCAENSANLPTRTERHFSTRWRQSTVFQRTEEEQSTGKITGWDIASLRSFCKIGL